MPEERTTHKIAPVDLKQLIRYTIRNYDLGDVPEVLAGIIGETLDALTVERDSLGAVAKAAAAYNDGVGKRGEAARLAALFDAVDKARASGVNI